MIKTVVIERKPLSLSERTYLPQIASGLKTTLSNLFKKKVTLQYPEQRPSIPRGYRGVPTLVKDPNGREKCVSCQLCEFVCPSKAIRITPGDIPEDDEEQSHVEKAPKEFEIDMLRCIYCGYCEEVCPEEAIFLQEDYSLSGYSREELVNDKEKLYEMGGTLPDKHFKWDKKKTEEEQGNAH
ncbi:MAG: NADH-quinone oxidoreductase subunit I [Verrucomicrobia bacterium]|nr:NADH-quinone oxidoreductase subunit I [Verrucomicrobiota bacterium]MDA0725188.1 NADH-quinone oxidoreductase subunit I [Verrucomicrobiota bacterium]MDA1047886.1 NADH-quinone oxidoreductase subunit I [Verrucomicrobiota bacterium]